jgi:hypothetical protein
MIYVLSDTLESPSIFIMKISIFSVDCACIDFLLFSISFGFLQIFNFDDFYCIIFIYIVD